MTNDATFLAFTISDDGFHFEQAATPAPPGPNLLQIVIKGKPYTGAHTRRAIKAALTRAEAVYFGVRCGQAVDGEGNDVGYTAFTRADLPWLPLG
jgi:hypothetical protein